MKLGLHTVIAAAALLVMSVGCSSGNGFFGQDLPAGDIKLADAVSGVALTTTPTTPYTVPANSLRFAIAISETRFNGPFTVSVIKQTSVPSALNGGFTYPYTFNIPCFVAHQPADSSSHANVVSFIGDNANSAPYNYPNGSVPQPPPTPVPVATGTPSPAASATPLPGGDPCHSGELETALISDTKGHSLLFYYEEE